MLFVAHGELMASLGPAAAQHLPAVLRLHALAESVRVAPSPLTWLKRPLHEKNTPQLLVNR